MRHTILLAGLLAFSSGANAQSSKLAAPAGFEAELTSIRTDFNKNIQAFYRSLEKADDKEWEKALKDPERNPTKKSVDKLIDLAGRAEGSPVSIQAKVYAMQLALNADLNDDYKRLLKECLEKHMTSPDIEPIANLLTHRGDPVDQKDSLKYLKQIETQSPHHNIQAAAINSQIHQVYEDYMGTGDADAAKKLAQRLSKDYSDTRYGKDAPNLIFQLDNLQVGKVAPDIEGEDADGVKFKLSDYRGKVVVIDFWGWW